MLEQNGVLATWQLTTLPAAWHHFLKLAAIQENDTVLAIRLADHRLAYLDYEGPISGNRGEVYRIEEGTFEIEQQSKESLRVVLVGKKLRGVVQLTQTTNDAKTWQLQPCQQC